MLRAQDPVLDAAVRELDLDLLWRGWASAVSRSRWRAKDVENLFGSIALAADQPFHVGDFVRVEDITGNVERIGVRSTQIRTPDRTLITMPNGRLSELRIEDFSRRDRMRFVTTLKLVHGTSEGQLKRILAGHRASAPRRPEAWPDEVQVNLVGLSPSSLDIDIVCWFRTVARPGVPGAASDGADGDHQDLVGRRGASFAVPMQAIQVTRDGGTLRPAPKRGNVERRERLLTTGGATAKGRRRGDACAAPASPGVRIIRTSMGNGQVPTSRARADEPESITRPFESIPIVPWNGSGASRRTTRWRRAIPGAPSSVPAPPSLGHRPRRHLPPRRRRRCRRRTALGRRCAAVDRDARPRSAVRPAAENRRRGPGHRLSLRHVHH